MACNTARSVNKESNMPTNSRSKQSKTRSKSSSKMPTGTPKRSKRSSLQPEIKYVYRKDAFKKVKIA